MKCSKSVPTTFLCLFSVHASYAFLRISLTNFSQQTILDISERCLEFLHFTFLITLETQPYTQYQDKHSTWYKKVKVASYQCHKCVGRWYEIPYHDHQILLDAVHMNTLYELHVVLGHRHSYASDVTSCLWLNTLTTAPFHVIHTQLSSVTAHSFNKPQTKQQIKYK